MLSVQFVPTIPTWERRTDIDAVVSTSSASSNWSGGVHAGLRCTYIAKLQRYVLDNSRVATTTEAITKETNRFGTRHQQFWLKQRWIRKWQWKWQWKWHCIGIWFVIRRWKAFRPWSWKPFIVGRCFQPFQQRNRQR
mmetsp:Transcript_1014/g.2405  ORF Transcript_1014/g.2405 Transcript_1014/m.2405 type:complete len:137 (-) Transcript_1014:23-433(-)